MAVKYKYSNLYYKEKELEGPISRVIAPYLKLKMQVAGRSLDMPLYSKELFLKNHGNLFWQLTIDYKAVASDLSTTYHLYVSENIISGCKTLKDVIDYIIALKNSDIKKRRLF